MARNRVYERANQLPLPVPSGTASGDPIVLEQLPAVALMSRDAADGKATVQFDGVFRLSVRGWNGTANVAIAAGDILYFNSGDTPRLNRRTAGVRFGYALEAVASGATADIMVKVGY